MKFWSSPFPIDKETEVLLNKFDIKYKELDEIDNKNDCILIYDTPDNIFNNLITNSKGINQFKNNINGYIKIKEILESQNFKAFAAWHIKSLSNSDFKKIIIEDSFDESDIKDHNLSPKSINPFISMVSLGFININPIFLESYIDLELTNNLFGRKFDGDTIERLNLDLSSNKLEPLFDAIENINTNNIEHIILKKEFDILNTQNNKKDLKLDKCLNKINELQSNLNKKNLKLDKYVTEIDKLNSNLNKKDLKLDKYVTEIDELNSNLNKKDQLIKEIEKNLNQLNYKLENKNKELSNLKENRTKLKDDLENKNEELEKYTNQNYVLNDELKLDKLQISFLQKEMEENLAIAESNHEILAEYTIQLERSKRLLNQLFTESSGGKISKIRDIDKLTNYPAHNKTLKFQTYLKKIFSNIYLKNK